MNCKICNGDVEFYFSKNNVDIFKCKDCNFQFHDLKEFEIKNIYNNDYYHNTKYTKNDFYNPVSKGNEFMLDKFIGEIGNNILEIGPSINGGLIKYFLNKNKNLYSVDISENVVQFLNKQGIASYSNLSSLKKANIGFDFIIMEEVIEHIKVPQCFVEETYSLLNGEVNCC